MRVLKYGMRENHPALRFFPAERRKTICDTRYATGDFLSEPRNAAVRTWGRGPIRWPWRCSGGGACGGGSAVAGGGRG